MCYICKRIMLQAKARKELGRALTMEEVTTQAPEGPKCEKVMAVKEAQKIHNLYGVLPRGYTRKEN